MDAEFEAADLIEALATMSDEERDALPFGLITMDRNGDVVHYNASESALSGLAADIVVGRNFFASVGPCTNNQLIAQRYADESELDEQLDFVFTFRMAPTPVRLRMLARSDLPHQYLAVVRR